MPLPNPVPIPFPLDFVDGVPTTNYRKGRFGAIPDVIVIHITDGLKQGVIAHFRSPTSQVSAHFLVCKDGSISQFVSTGDTAYANGVIDNPVSELVLQRGQKDPNAYSISIEHEGFANVDLTAAQYQASAKLVKFLHDKWGIPLDRTHVIAHTEVTARKVCPGLINVEKIIQLARTQ